MIESVIYLLIYVCLLVLVVYLVLYVFKRLEIDIPERVVQIIWLIVALLVILALVQMFMAGGRVPRLVW